MFPWTLVSEEQPEEVLFAECNEVIYHKDMRFCDIKKAKLISVERVE